MSLHSSATALSSRQARHQTPLFLIALKRYWSQGRLCPKARLSQPLPRQVLLRDVIFPCTEKCFYFKNSWHGFKCLPEALSTTATNMVSLFKCSTGSKIKALPLLGHSSLETNFFSQNFSSQPNSH